MNKIIDFIKKLLVKITKLVKKAKEVKDNVKVVSKKIETNYEEIGKYLKAQGGWNKIGTKECIVKLFSKIKELEQELHKNVKK